MAVVVTMCIYYDQWHSLQCESPVIYEPRYMNHVHANRAEHLPFHVHIIPKPKPIYKMYIMLSSTSSHFSHWERDNAWNKLDTIEGALRISSHMLIHTESQVLFIGCRTFHTLFTSYFLLFYSHLAIESIMWWVWIRKFTSLGLFELILGGIIGFYSIYICDFARNIATYLRVSNYRFVSYYIRLLIDKIRTQTYWCVLFRLTRSCFVFYGSSSLFIWHKRIYFSCSCGVY
eukprot:1087982_1